MTELSAPQQAAILHAVAAAKYPRMALGDIAHHHQTTLQVVQAVCQRHGYPDKTRMLRAANELLAGRAPEPTPEPRPAPAAQTEEPTSKTCTSCGETKPLSEFYSASDTRDRHASHCRVCNNRRRPTEIRLLRNRARNRAYQLLVKAHQDEYTRLYDAEYEKARVEHERLQAQAAAQGNHDATVARLRPGPKRKTQADVTERLDVARCLSCHTHHDADHECPSCGDTTPETAPQVKPWAIRAWAIAQGMDCPTHGPISRKIRDAYDTAHRQEEVSAS